MNNRWARETAMQVLFQSELNKPLEGADYIGEEELAWEMVLGEAPAEPEVSARDIALAKKLVAGTRENLPRIDEALAKFSRTWKLKRMANVDRNIARLAVFEMKFAPRPLKPEIAINEAVELAKKYGTDDSARFINGLLGDIARAAAGQEEPGQKL